ncbi:MAG: hypothetical protein AVDCRST_MAG67-1545 [uncultured Solirubrobacteraceae bacterium]|uniref:Uncharacterized protein n=1 Tax=uncultured Solirubrobacteraceae bacterium TaxID=1162706 RepID=A0A6J4SKK4_9ACTN|nr:MAG: hypothetical protein AVDCRST_MAG67-1545 [uncultured Solirubrobacteraceae bacterium]
MNNAAGAEANRDLFDAIEYAATEARLALDELVDAYIAGAPDLQLGEAWEDVADYLQRVAAAHPVQHGQRVRADRARPARLAPAPGAAHRRARPRDRRTPRRRRSGRAHRTCAPRGRRRP